MSVGSAGAGLGIQPFYSTIDVPVSTYGNATVNLANGNLVLQTQAVKYDSPGIPVNIAAFANSLATGVGGMGAGALINTGQDVGLAIGTTAVTFYGPSGFTAVFNSSGTGGWLAPAGMNADLARRPDATWTLTYHATGEALVFSSGGYLIKDIDRSGLGLSLAYDPNNRLKSLTDGAGRVTNFAYNSAGFVSSISDPFGRTTAYGYATSGVMNKITYPDGSVVNLPSQPASLTSMIQSPNGNWARFTYDSTHRVVQLDRYLTAGAQSGAASTTKFNYTSPTAISVTNPLGGVSTYTLDSVGRTVKTVDPSGRTSSTTWTANNDLATDTDPDGKVTTYTYDALNNPIRQSSPTGATTSATYSASPDCNTSDTTHPYDVKCATDDAGKTQATTYDVAGNISSTTDTTPGGTGASDVFTYQSTDTSGVQCGGKPGAVCSHTNARGKTTSYRYDVNGNQIRIVPPAPLAPTTRTYDSAGRVLTQTDGLGQVTSYAYDIDDRVTKITMPSGAIATNSYDKDGNLTNTVDSEQGTTSYAFDTLDRETSRLDPSMTSAVTTGYDNVGNVTSVTDSQGTVVNTYNAVSQLTAVTEPGAYVTRYAYSASGNQVTQTLPNGVMQTTTIDASSRVSEITAVGPSGAVLTDFVYAYAGSGSVGDDRNLLQSRIDKVGVGAPAMSTTTYAYDSLNRLTSAIEKTSTGSVNAMWAYTYDAVGNRLTQALTGATVASAPPTTALHTTSWAYNDADQLIARDGSSAGWSYDDNGRQISSPDWGTATYNQRGSLASITKNGFTVNSEMYGYLGIGNAQRIRAGNRKYSNGPLGLNAETNEMTGVTRSYHQAAPGQLLGSIDSSGSRQYYLVDNLGSTVAITDGSGAETATYSYDPYGGTRSATGPAASSNPMRYAGGYLDFATGLYKFGARYYDTATARFTEQDPSRSDANLYNYAGADPINCSDPTGLYVTVPWNYHYYKTYHLRRTTLNDYCSYSPDVFYGPGGSYVSFRGPCAYHDLCYQKFGATSFCDNWLLSDLRENCAMLSRGYQLPCVRRADEMVWVVRRAHGR